MMSEGQAQPCDRSGPLPDHAAVLFRSLDDLPSRLRGCALSIGNFDGVHLGHARIAQRLVALARRVGGAAVMLTFEPHPAHLLRPEQAPTPLTWIERKVALLAEQGVDAVVAYPTTREFLQLEPREFFDRIVLGALAAQGMVEGNNFFFGHARRGTIEVLGQFCAEARIALDIAEPVTIDGRIVSSSRVRASIAEGQVEEVGRLLTRPYRIRGRVVHGAGRGNRLGYPTANVEQIDTLLPGEGIYAGRAWIGQSVYATAMSIGGNPTFGEAARKVEAFLLDYHGDLYDRTIEIDFLARLRDIRKFDSAEELIAQMAKDVERTREIADLAIGRA